VYDFLKMVDANMYCFCLSALEFGILGKWVLVEQEDMGGARLDRSLDEFCVVYINKEVPFF
jgi:hypothetical protein